MVNLFESQSRIDSFDGEYRFLSNFYPSEIVLMDRSYATVEHAYQAFKTSSFVKHEEIRLAATPGIAKRLGQKVDLIPNWENQKVLLMALLIKNKFRDENLRQRLLDTGNALLIEGNTWGDTFWGMCKGKGANNLGILLMKERKCIAMKSTI